MSIRKKIVTMLGVFALLAGLALVTPQQAQATTGHPYLGANGYNSTSMPSYDTAYGWKSLDLTWQIVDLGPYGTGGCESYNYTTKKATYRGAAIGKVVAYVDTSESGIGANLVNGSGSDNSTALLGSGGSLPNGTTKTNGVSGVSWPTINIKWCPGDTRIRRVVASFYTSGYLGAWTGRGSGVIDLTVKGHLDVGAGVNTGTFSTTLKCSDPSVGVGIETLALTYEIDQVAVDSYLFELHSAAYQAMPGKTEGASSIELTLNGDVNKDLTSGSANWDQPYPNPSPPSWSETEGVGGITYPTRTFTDGSGDNPRIEAIFRHDEISAFTACGPVDYYLHPIWQTPAPRTDHVAFNDCVAGSQPHGDLAVTSTWREDTNQELVQLTGLTIQNNSGNEVRWITNTPSNTNGGLLLQSLTGSITTQSTGTPSTELKILAGATLTVDLGSSTKWIRLDGSSGPAAPSGITLPQSPAPLLTVEVESYVHSTGLICDYAPTLTISPSV